MPEQRTTIQTEAVFSGFRLDPSVPHELTVQPSGLLGSSNPEQSTVSLYVVRRSVAITPVGGDPATLFNSMYDHGNSHPAMQATEGHGLYAGSVPRAVERVLFVRGDNLYLLRIDTEPGRVLDAMNVEANRSAPPSVRRAARWLRWRSRVPAIGGPGGYLPGAKRVEAFARAYEGKHVVSFAPMAPARALTGRHQTVSGRRLPIKWAVIPDARHVQIVGTKIRPADRA